MHKAVLVQLLVMIPKFKGYQNGTPDDVGEVSMRQLWVFLAVILETRQAKPDKRNNKNTH
ncbi:MAG TPA: hypothetical protein VJ440_07770 [Candidatus Brocadiaceae bacterium]|nr:hypothetical protein [Candidatus Brocadiaceae bacterium]